MSSCSRSIDERNIILGRLDDTPDELIQLRVALQRVRLAAA
jgi:hypothetical protein